MLFLVCILDIFMLIYTLSYLTSLVRPCYRHAITFTQQDYYYYMYFMYFLFKLTIKINYNIYQITNVNNK